MANEKLKTDDGEKRFLVPQFNKWFLRVTVPQKVRHRFDSKKVLVRSLETHDIKEARRLRGNPDALKDGDVLKELRFNFELASRDAERFRQEELAAIQRKHLRKRRTDRWGMTETRTAKEQAEFERDKARAYELGSPEIAESLGVPLPKGTPLDSNEADFLQPLEPKTRIQYKHSLKILRGFLRSEGKPEAIESVDGKMAVAFRKLLISQEMHRKTAAAHLSANRSRWQFLINEQIIEPPNPWVGISMPRPKRGSEPPRRPYTDAELEALFQGDPGQPLFDIMTLLLLTGLRRGEPMAMKVGAYKDGWFTLREGKTASAVRRVPVPKLIRPALDKMLKGRDPGEYLFNEESKAKNQSRGNLIGQQYLRYRRNVGVTDKRSPMHSFRHTASTWANDAGYPRHDVQGLIGHDGTKRTTTDIYTVIGDAKRIEIIESIAARLPPKVKTAIKARFGKP